MRNKTILFTLAAASQIFSVLFAVREDSQYFANLEKVMEVYHKKSISGSFWDKDGVNIAYRVFGPEDNNLNPLEHERAALVLLPGRGMPMQVFAETIYDLLPLGFTIYILDHRGQGNSGRLVANSQKQYVESFDDYVDNFSTFIDMVVKPANHTNLFLLAESMGGAIASLYMKKYPDHKFKAAILAAPMFGLNTKPFPEGLLYWTARLVSYLGGKDSYFFRQGDFEPISAQKSIVIRSEARYTMMNRIFKEYNVATGGVSFQWFIAAKNAIYELRDFSFTIPTLILQAENERVVCNDAQTIICERSKNCQVMALPDAYHELFLEKDTARDVMLREIAAYFTKHL